MVWLLHPDDFDHLVALAKPWTPRPPGVVDETRDDGLAQLTGIATGMPLGGQVIARCYVLERGHIQDTDHPELGAPTFAEYGEAHVKIMEAERVRFDETMAAIEKYMRPMPKLTGYGMAYPPVSRFVIDPKAL